MVTLELRILLVFLVAYLSAAFVIPRLASIARTIGLVDRPERRKVHRVPRPLVGGIGFVIAATFSSMLFVPLQGFRGLFLGLAVLLFIGFLDDFRQLNARSRFVAQIAAAMLMIYFSKVRLLSFGDLISCGDITLCGCEVLTWAVTIFCLVGVINAINLIDGLDGLAGGVSFIAFLTFALHASFAGAQVLMLLNLAFAGAVLGFLRFNWHPSVVFMGDAGSLCLGFTLGFMAIVMSQGDRAVFPPIVALLVLAVPITDTLTVMTKRVLRGHSPFKADRYHLHHILMRYGMNRDTAVKVILGICMALSGLTLLTPFYHIPEWWLFAVYLGYFIVYVVSSLFIISILKMTIRRRRRQNNNGRRNVDTVVQSVLKGLDYVKILRKDKRYEVNLAVRCRLPECDSILAGHVENISRRGCRASIPDLATMQYQVDLEIMLPLDSEIYTLHVQAEHIWINESYNEQYHGFKFQDGNLDADEMFARFLTRCRRHTANQ